MGRLAAALSVLAMVAGGAHATTGPLARCEKQKLGTAGKGAKQLLGCHARAADRGTLVDPACLAKAHARLANGFVKAELKDPCPFTGDASAVSTALDALVEGAASALMPPTSASRCAGRKLAAAGKYASDVLKAEGKHALRPEKESLGPKVAKAADRLAGAWTKAESEPDCVTTGDQSAIADQIRTGAAPAIDAVRGTLRALAGGRLVGSAIRYDALGTPEYDAVAARHFNFVSTWGETVWINVEPQQGVFNLAPLDEVVDFAEQHGQTVKGITLVWHELLPLWMKNLTDPVAFRDAMEHHVTTLVGGYAGRIHVWDVVNEAVTGGQLRDSEFLQRLGPDYVADAFHMAHAADPSALLFYNDFGIETLNANSDFLYQLVQDLLADGVPIDGVGFQMHIGVTSTWSASQTASLQANLQRFADLGLRVQLAEAEVSLGEVVPGATPVAQLSAGERRAGLLRQGERYHDMVAICLDIVGCDVNFFGFTDAYFWVTGFPFPNAEPLMFDAAYHPKPAFFGVRDALLGY